MKDSLVNVCVCVCVCIYIGSVGIGISDGSENAGEFLKCNLYSTWWPVCYLADETFVFDFCGTETLLKVSGDQKLYN